MRLLRFLVPPTGTRGRQRNYHRVIYLVGVGLLAAVLLAPLRVAGVIVVAAFVVWWLADSLRPESCALASSP